MDLYVGQRACGLSLGAKTSPSWLHGLEPAAAVQQLLQPLRRKRSWFGPRLRVWLSGALARPIVMQPVIGLQQRAEADMLAAQAAREAGLDWSVPALWLSDPLLKQTTVVVAADRGQLRQLQGLVDEAGLKVKQLSPWWRLALDATLQQSKDCDALLIEDTDGLCWLHCAGGNWTAADYRSHVGSLTAVQPANAVTPEPEQEAWVARRLFSAGLDPTSVDRAALNGGMQLSAAGWPMPAIHWAAP